MDDAEVGNPAVVVERWRKVRARKLVQEKGICTSKLMNILMAVCSGIRNLKV